MPDANDRTDPDASTRASHDVWEAMAAGWDRRHAFLERVTRPVTERMIERLEPAPGQEILDLAAGTGVVGLAVARSVGDNGRVLIGDFSEAMVAAAERRAAELGASNVECRVLDAQDLDLPDDAVDAVVCRWGYMLMPDPGAALAETRRVLRDGGRLAFAVFASPADNPWAALPVQVLVAQGHMPPPQPGTPGILALGDPDRLRSLVTGAGFSEPRIEDVRFTWELEDVDAYWRLLNETAGALATVLARLDETASARVRDEIADRLQAEPGAPVELAAASLVVSAA